MVIGALRGASLTGAVAFPSILSATSSFGIADPEPTLAGESAYIPPAGVHSFAMGGGGSGVRNPAEIIDTLEEDLSLIGVKGNKLRYLHGAAVVIERMSADEADRDPHNLLTSVHRLASVTDDVMDFIDAVDQHEEYGVDIADITRPLYIAADRAESAILSRRELTLEVQEMIADVHSLEARKGLYYRALRKRDELPQNNPGLYLTVLHLLDASARYTVLGLYDKAEILEDYLAGVSVAHNLPDDTLLWALATFDTAVDINVEFVARTRFDARSFDPLYDALRLAWKAMTRGIYTFSPYMFQSIAAALEHNGLEELSWHYNDHTKFSMETAKKLGLNAYFPY